MCSSDLLIFFHKLWSHYNFYSQANRQIGIMEKVIADPENEKHKPLIQAAFGDKADVNIMRDNIEKLKTGNVPV